MSQMHMGSLGENTLAEFLELENNVPLNSRVLRNADNACQQSSAKTRRKQDEMEIENCFRNSIAFSEDGDTNVEDIKTIKSSAQNFSMSRGTKNAVEISNQNETDVAKYFEASVTFSKEADTNVKDDKSNRPITRKTSTTQGSKNNIKIPKRDKTDLAKYFEDSIAFSELGKTNAQNIKTNKSSTRNVSTSSAFKNTVKISMQDETDAAIYFQNSITFSEYENTKTEDLRTNNQTTTNVTSPGYSKNLAKKNIPNRNEIRVGKDFIDTKKVFGDGDTNAKDIKDNKSRTTNNVSSAGCSKDSENVPKRNETRLDTKPVSNDEATNLKDIKSNKPTTNNDLSAGCSKTSVNILKRNDTDVAKYFEDSIAFSDYGNANAEDSKTNQPTTINVLSAGCSKYSDDIPQRNESEVGKQSKNTINNKSVVKKVSRIKKSAVSTKHTNNKTRKSTCFYVELGRNETLKYESHISKIPEESFNVGDENLNNKDMIVKENSCRIENADDSHDNKEERTNIIREIESENVAKLCGNDGANNSIEIRDSEDNICSSDNQILVNGINKNIGNKVGGTEVSTDILVKRNEVKENRESNASVNHAADLSSISESSIIRTQDRCNLASWGLPPVILQKYESIGVRTMFPWQVECLSNQRVLEENRNLVYSAPTSAGKTLVAEILVIKTILERQKKVIFILPFVSVVREKMFYFQDLLSSSGIRVEGFMGGNAPAGGFAAIHMAVATIEKANSLVNRLMEEGDLVTLGAVVIDELHLLGDPSRGYLLELLLTKLKYMTLREEHVKVQLIGMSATLPNLPLLADWLDAKLYKTEFRPVPLNEQCKIDTTIYDNKLAPIRKLVPSLELPMDTDNIIQLCIETIADGHSTLIFCPTKNWCEKLAHQIASTFFKLGSQGTSFRKILREQLNSNAIAETLEQLKRCPVGLDDVLKGTVSFGVAFHHAGLTMDERDVIEGSFRSGSLRVLIATSTLSSGVNLPARRVIIRSIMFHGKVLDALTYRQMIGRAGRMGKDTAGESILICKPNERRSAESLLSACLEPIASCLEGAGPLIRALLEAVASEVAYTPEDVDLYTRCTLVSFSEEGSVEKPTKDAMKFLVYNEFIMLQRTNEGEERWVATPLGKACLASSVPPEDGLFLFEELQRARRCFVLETELHIIYLVTPFNSGSQIGQIDWMVFLELWKSLSECERRVGELVGVEERFLMSSIRGIVKPGKTLNIHRRFYTALALHDLVRETPLATVSDKYGCNRGILQSLQQSASAFAGMVTQFCKQLGWDCMELLVTQFQQRLQFGVCRELLDLLRLPMLNGLRARSLYKEGITCVSELATADELTVERALHKALPFESEKEQDGEHEAEAAKRNKLRSVFVTGRDGLTPREAATMLVHEARTLVQHELGVEKVQWKQYEQETNTKMQIKFYSHKSNRQILNSTSAQSTRQSTSRREDSGANDKQTKNNICRAVSDDGDVENSCVPNVEKTAQIDENQNGTSSKPNKMCSNTSLAKAEINICASVTNKQIDWSRVLRRTARTASRKNAPGTKNNLQTPEEMESIKSAEVMSKTHNVSLKNVSDKNDISQQNAKEIATCTNVENPHTSVTHMTSVETVTKDQVQSVTAPVTEAEIVEIPRTNIKLKINRMETLKSKKVSNQKRSEIMSRVENMGMQKLSEDIIILSDDEDENDFLMKTEDVNSKGLNKATKTSKFKLLGAVRNSRQNAVSKTDITIVENSENVLTSRHKVIPRRSSDALESNPDFVKEIRKNKRRSDESLHNSRMFENETNKRVKRRESKKDVNNINGPFKNPLVEMVRSDPKLCTPLAVTLTYLDSDGRSGAELNSVDKNGKLGFTKANDIYSESRSPSLFGDSFTLDTQMCNELEQNINSSMDMFDESRLSGVKLGKSIVRIDDNKPLNTIEHCSVTNISKINLPTNIKAGNQSIVDQNLRPESLEIKDQVPISGEMSFTWNSEIWSNMKNATGLSGRNHKAQNEKINKPTDILKNSDLKKKLDRSNKLQLTRENIVKCTEASYAMNDSNEIVPTPPTKDSKVKSLISKSRTQNIQNIKSLSNFTISSPRKRENNETRTASEKSPIVSLVSFGYNRRLSIDSPKSDSDDLIGASQSLETGISTSKSRTRVKLENKKLATQKMIEGSVSKSNKNKDYSLTSKIVQNARIIEDKADKIKNIYKHTRAQQLLNSENCSTDSIVLNSDDDDHVNKSKDHHRLREGTNNSTFVEQKAEPRQSCKEIRLDSNTDNESSNANENPDWNVLDIINVTCDKRVFDLFKHEIKQETEIAIALACDRFVNDTVGIGAKIIGINASEGRKKSQKNESCVNAETRVSGVALSWGRNVVYYICFDTTHEANISLKERLDLLTDVLTISSLKVRCFASKEVYKTLNRCCGITPSCTFLDSKVADWLIYPEANEKNFVSMTAEYFPQGITILQHAGPCVGPAGPGLDVTNTLPGRHRAAAEAVINWYTVNQLMEKLNALSTKLLDTYRVVEMKTISALARMELSGLGVNLASLQELSTVIQKEMNSLEQRAFSLTRKKFNFSSSKEVAQVLGMYKGKKISTSKAVLKHCDNPISSLVMSWRKLSATQTKMVFPLLNQAQYSSRIHGTCVTNTATGRVSMHEPNLQNVPRDFKSENNKFVISVRMAFGPSPGNIMLSADYCQLELRILAHFSNDSVLCEILRKEGDVFKTIAATWNHVSENEVDDNMRQQTKQLCYGMIYGMGVRTLAEQLSVTELEAGKFMETFMGTYPAVRHWLIQVVECGRADGYVTTLMGRRRPLPGLNSQIQGEKSQAERQAVNVKVQGSAADLAKKAMVIIEEALEKEFPNAPRVLPGTAIRRLRSSKESQSRGGYLVLQLHDELLYEVNEMDLHRVATIVKGSMENAYQLTVPLPVKVKVGPTWGELTEYQF